MKHAGVTVAALVVAAGVSFPATSRAGSAPGTFPVSATVQSSCAMGTVNNVVFPAYDVFASAPLTASATFQFTCTKGTTFTSVDLSAASGAVGSRKMSSGASAIAYELYQPSADGASASCPNTATWGAGVPAGAGKGYKPSAATSRNVPTTLRVCAVVPSQGADVPAGTYVDTVTISVNYN